MKITHNPTQLPSVEDQLKTLWELLEVMHGAQPFPHAGAEAMRKTIKAVRANAKARPKN